MTSLIEMVGNTPLYQIPYPKNKNITLYAKLEYHNPSGSVKDRAASFIIKDALKTGKLNKKILIDATSGNTGIAYAMYGASLGIPIELALPENASPERILILKNYGAKLHLTSPLEATDGSQRYVADLVADNPKKYFYADQYNNENNWKSHLETTAPEIWSQTNGEITHFIAGLGTTGTFCGTSRYLQPKGVSCIAVHPDNPIHGLEGWKHLETAIVPGIYDPKIADNNVTVSTESAFSFAKASANYLGLMISPSAAANLKAAMDLAKTLKEGIIVTTFADNAMKYLQDKFWSDDDYTIENPFI